jgi:hypothetical protein
MRGGIAAFAISMATVQLRACQPPRGLAGGRSGAALLGGARLRVVGGSVREIDSLSFVVRSQAPRTEIQLETGSWEPREFDLILTNVDADATSATLEGDSPYPRGAPELRRIAPNAVQLEVGVAQGRATYTIESSGDSDEASFFVFSAVREGLDVFQGLLDIADRERPDFIVGLGDLYRQASADDLRSLDRRLASASTPVYLVPGADELKVEDYDWRDEGGDPLARLRRRERFVALFGEPNQAFHFRGWRFVFFDNARLNPRPSPKWIEDLIANEPTSPRTILFSHFPPLDPPPWSVKEDARLSRRDRERLIGWLRDLEVDAAFFGHHRGYMKERVGETDIFVTAAAGALLPPGAGRAHFLDVRLRGDERTVERRILRSARDASVVGHDIPARMTPGERREVRITMRNEGTESWSDGPGYYLSAPADRDPFAFRRHGIDEGRIVAPGETFTFVLPFRAPREPGRHATRWMMILEDVERFGELLEVEIEVGDPAR